MTGLTVLARGGYATVYKANQESVDRDVAVKVENRSLDTEHDRRRFMREARAAGRMSSHPHVVDLFDAGVTQDGHPYLIMELCAGSYADRLRSAPLSPAEARDVGVKIADALADAHTLGVLHRDVKPANLLVSGFGEPALADFGLAVLTEMRGVSMTLEVLTPAYAPREMFRSGCAPSPAADVYSLCATLYALLRGKPPRWHDDRDPSLITLMELFDRPIPSLPGVPRDLLELVRLGMSNDSDARPTAQELRDRLAALELQGGAVPAEDAVRVTPVRSSQPESWSMPTQPRPAGLLDEFPSGATAQPEVVGEFVGAAGLVGGSGLVPGRPGGQPSLLAAVRSRLSGSDRPAWRPVAGAGAVLVVLGLLITTAIWYGFGANTAARAELRTQPVASATPKPSLSPGPSSSSSRVPGLGGGCLLGAVGASCPTSAQCFDRITVSSGVAQARTLPCTQPHTWEVFALGKLPPDVGKVGYPAVKEQESVARICSTATLLLVNMNAQAWQVDVVPPSPEAFAGGDRTFRCVAGTGPNRQSTPIFAH